MSKGKIWTGRVMGIVATLILLSDSIGKIMKTKANIDGFAASGFDPKFCVPIGIMLLVCLVLFVIPRTSFIGALLLTAHLGGATAMNVLTGGSVLLILFPVVVALFLWGSLYVASPSLRNIILKDIRR